ncbi:MAG: T9SS type A sorting domain-containing protein [Saprospiraceae bacterium]|nr:T9SS type A sorting domain-containing protein [Saprospiraceae bacterium]
MNKDNLGLTQMDNGFITVSWNAFESVQVKSSDKLFTIVLKALSTSTLSQSIHMNSAITTAEAYDQNLIEKDIRLSFRSDNGIISDNGIVLYQNNPNPFSDNTVIGFEVPKAAKATLSIYDLTGKVLFVKEVNTVKGYNSVRVNNSQLGVTGILFYQLDAEGYSATRRMLVIQ